MDNQHRAMDKCMDRQAAHTLIHSPAATPVTHKLHSLYCGDRDKTDQKEDNKKREVVTAQLPSSRFRDSKCTFIMYLP